jgi:hypothetical protein
MHVPGLAADKGFIRFHLATVAAQLASKELILHGEPNPVEHEPCAFLRNLHIPRDFVAADSVLAVSEEPGCGEPLVKADGGVFHHSSNLDGEFSLGMMAGASPSPAMCPVINLFVSASRALYDTIRPTLGHKMRNAIIGIGEVYYGFLKALWFGIHNVPTV